MLTVSVAVEVLKLLFWICWVKTVLYVLSPDIKTKLWIVLDFKVLNLCKSAVIVFWFEFLGWQSIKLNVSDYKRKLTDYKWAQPEVSSGSNKVAGFDLDPIRSITNKQNYTQLIWRRNTSLCLDWIIDIFKSKVLIWYRFGCYIKKQLQTATEDYEGVYNCPIDSE